MKNFLNDFLTGTLALLAAISAFITLFTGIAIVLQKPGFGLIFAISAVAFICLLWLTAKRKGGWSEFVAAIFPWWP